MRKKFLIFNFKFLIYILIGLLFVYLVWSSLRNSLFFKRKDRLNLVFYGESSAFYSLALDDSVSYFISLPSDIRILLPGGFGYYRLGALGKLVSLEKRPDLYRKSFSTMTSSFVDQYFYKDVNKIYFNQKGRPIFFPTFSQIFFNQTNGSIFDRAYIFIVFITRQKNQFLEIDDLPLTDSKEGLVLDERLMLDRLVGYFYQKTYRKENKTVQLIYTKKEENCHLLSKIIEGQGIRVVDFSYGTSRDKTCLITESSKKTSQTARALADFFDCPVKNGDTGSYDIIFQLGDREEEWAVK